MKRLLFISESPLEKFENKYYAKDTWIKFPLELSKHYDLTILTPVYQSENKPSEINKWPISQANAGISELPNYSGFGSLFKKILIQYGVYRKKIKEE